MMRVELAAISPSTHTIERISHGLDRVKAGNNILRPPNIERRDIEADRTGAGLYGAPLQYAIGIIEVCHNRQAMEIGDSLAKKFYSFAGEIGGLQRQSGDVAAWMRKISYETAADRIVGHRKDNGNDGRRPLQRRNARSIRNNNIDFPLRELGRQSSDAFGVALRPAIFNGDVAAFNPAQLTKASRKGCRPCAPHRHVGAQDYDRRHFPRLLRARRKRP
jgi:hypothetical protein